MQTGRKSTTKNIQERRNEWKNKDKKEYAQNLPSHHGEWIEDRIEKKWPIATSFSPTVVQGSNGPINDLETKRRRKMKYTCVLQKYLKPNSTKMSKCCILPPACFIPFNQRFGANLKTPVYLLNFAANLLLFYVFSTFA